MKENIQKIAFELDHPENIEYKLPIPILNQFNINEICGEVQSFSLSKNTRSLLEGVMSEQILNEIIKGKNKELEIEFRIGGLVSINSEGKKVFKITNIGLFPKISI